MSIQLRINMAIWGIVIIISAFFLHFLLKIQKYEYLEGIDKQLISGAVMARIMVGSDYHDHICDKNSVSSDTYLKIVDRYNKACLQSGLQYLWSNLFLKDGSIVFTTGTSISKEVKNGDHAMFFDIHSDPKAFDEVKRTNKNIFSTFDNKWGKGRMVLMPWTDAKGRTYVFGASIALDDLNDRIKSTTKNTLLLFAFLLLAAAMISHWLVKGITKPIRIIDKMAKTIASGNFEIRLEPMGSCYEFESLAKSINQMSMTILKRDNELRTQKKELKTIIEASPAVIYRMVLPEGRYRYISPVAKKIFGYAPEVWYEQPKFIENLIHPDWKKYFYDEWKKMTKGNASDTYEYQIIRKDGAERWLSQSNDVTYDDSGKPVAITGILQDITEQKRLENNIRESEARFRSIFYNSSIGILVADLKKRKFQMANDAICKLLGYTEDHLLSISVMDIHPPEDFDWIIREFEKAASGEKLVTERIPMLRSDGTIFLADITSTLLTLNDRPHNVGLIQDVTKRYETEQELEKYKNHLEKLVEERTSTLKRAEAIAHVGSWHFDLVENVLTWSEEIYRIFCYPLEKPVNLELFLSKIHDDDRKKVIAKWNAALEGSCTYEIEHRIVTPKGIKWVVERAEIMFDSKNKPVIVHGAVQDITEAKKIQKELILAKEKAEAGIKTKSLFLANMSHEIRTPMNAIIGMTQLALKTGLEGKAQNYVKKVHYAAEGLLGILNDILDFSKIEANKLILSNVHFALKDIISPAINMIKGIVEEKSIIVRVKIDKELPRFFYADSMRLKQVLLNILNNAVKFSHEGGNVTVRVSLCEENDNEALIQFRVEDEGIGISKDIQKNLFQPFAQADSTTTREFGGTGLGLAISKKITELMGGNIWVESNEGKGSIFFFTVRMQKSNETFVSKESLDSELILKVSVKKLKGLKILLVEDNELNQELLEALMIDNELQVKIAKNGQEALDMLEQDKFDGILMDLHMPVMDGYEATRKIRNLEQYKDLPIIALSANAMKGDKERSMAAGMNDHISKPVKPVKMFETMALYMG